MVANAVPHRASAFPIGSAPGACALARPQYDEGMTKRRVTLTIDADLLDEARAAVNDGDASSVSAWVNQAMADKSENRRRLKALGEVIADYEAEFGKITPEEVAEQRRLDEIAAEQVRADGVRRRSQRELGA